MGDLSLWLTVVLAALIAVLAIYYAVVPLLQPGKAPLLVEDDKLAELLGRKDAALQAIKDLEFDYRVGKVSQEDYQRIDQRLRRQAIVLIQQIEKLAPASASLDQELESIIAHYRQTTVAPAVVSAPPARTPIAAPPMEAMPTPIATSAPLVASSDPAQVTRYCTQCGRPIEPGHKFCGYCGTPVAQADPAAQA
jgi:hypothetical protein